jgi:hypothetical protein
LPHAIAIQNSGANGIHYERQMHNRNWPHFAQQMNHPQARRFQPEVHLHEL